MEIISIALIENHHMSDEDYRADTNECIMVCQEKCISCIYKFLDKRIYVVSHRDLSIEDTYSWTYEQYEPRGRPECTCDNYIPRNVLTCKDVKLDTDEDGTITLSIGIMVFYFDPSKEVHEANTEAYYRMKILRPTELTESFHKYKRYFGNINYETISENKGRIDHIIYTSISKDIAKLPEDITPT